MDEFVQEIFNSCQILWTTAFCGKEVQSYHHAVWRNAFGFFCFQTADDLMHLCSLPPMIQKNFHSLFDLSLLLMILESSLLWLLFAKLILVFVVLWNCYNLVFYFFYFLFLRNSYIIFSDLSTICCIMGFQQGNVLEFIANRDAKNSCSSLAWPSLSCVLLLYLSNLLQHSSTGVLLATEKY